MFGCTVYVTNLKKFSILVNYGLNIVNIIILYSFLINDKKLLNHYNDDKLLKITKKVKD